jgi:hypothetical protein
MLLQVRSHFFIPARRPMNRSSSASRHSAITPLRITHRIPTSVLAIQYPWRERHRGGLVQYILSSPARLPRFLADHAPS